MSETIKFSVWADIHYDRLHSNCVKLDDFESIERNILMSAFRNDYDFTLFCGDRFKKRDPEDEVKTVADRVYKDFSYNVVRGRKDMSHFHLVGNHCWTENSMRWHTSMSLGDFPKITIMESPCTYVGNKNFRIHALPSGFEFNMDYFEIDPDCFNIFVFHDMLAGSFRSDEMDPRNIFDSGISIHDIDRPEFDLVLAGDIHVPQKFKLKNVKNGGGYCGAVVQLTKADANRDRGWLDITATKENGVWKTSTVFNKTRNFFTRISFNVNSETRYEDLKIDDNLVDDQLVEVKLIGDKAHVDRIADDERWSNYKNFMNVRGFDILRAYEAQKSEVSIDMTKSSTIADDLSTYLDSGFANLGTVDREKILDVFKEFSLGQ
jgi:DNA repair exonuclease SbcCD nuclease subunit